MIWYRNFAMGDNTVGYHPGQVAIGIVDAHPAPLLMADGHYARQRLQLMDAAFGLRPTIANTITLVGVPTTFPSLPAAKTFDDSKQFFYYQVKGSSVDYEGLMLPTLGVHVTVLSEKAGLTGASVFVSALPIA
jgi:immune inhibitor A